MRAFELNASLLIRKKKRLGDNDICWHWKEKASNQHILTRGGLCFPASFGLFHGAVDLLTYRTTWKKALGLIPVARNSGHLGEQRLEGSAGPDSAWAGGGCCREREGPGQELLLCGHSQKTSCETLLHHSLL